MSRYSILFLGMCEVWEVLAFGACSKQTDFLVSHLRIRLGCGSSLSSLCFAHRACLEYQDSLRRNHYTGARWQAGQSVGLCWIDARWMGHDEHGEHSCTVMGLSPVPRSPISQQGPSPLSQSRSRTSSWVFRVVTTRTSAIGVARWEEIRFFVRFRMPFAQCSTRGVGRAEATPLGRPRHPPEAKDRSKPLGALIISSKKGMGHMIAWLRICRDDTER